MINKKTGIYAIIVALIAGAGYYYYNSNTVKPCPEVNIKQYQNDKKDPIVLIQTDKCQNMIIRLNKEMAPNTVANFVKIIKDGKLNDTNFFRIIYGFVIQGGTKTEDSSKEATDNQNREFTIKGEFSSNGFAQNTLKHERGVISMARKQNLNDSAGQQFFIVHKNGEPAKSLDNEYAAFGKIVDDASYSVLDEIARSERAQSGENPVVPRVVKTVTVETFGEEYSPVRIYKTEATPTATTPSN
jgi:peptidyl-prolyl cis-trans isomerase B (cyclophilin B)